MLLPLLLALAPMGKPAPKPVRLAPIHVVVWDEQQPVQRQTYDNAFLGETIAKYLVKRSNENGGPSLEVKSVGLGDSSQGLSDETLEWADVIVWWGHQRHDEVKDELVAKITKRVREGKLAYIGLHSAHWSKTFIDLMNSRAVDDGLASLTKAERAKVKVVTIPQQKRQPGPNSPLTPSYVKETGADGSVTLKVTLANCAFPFVAADGTPGHITTLLPKHPIAKGIPEKFDNPQTEIYAGAFHVPTPDAKIFHEKWDNGQEFETGSYWKVGKGGVFYYRPGHETFPIFKKIENLRIVENAIVFLAGKLSK
jgi:trehalose utilization protein